MHEEIVAILEMKGYVFVHMLLLTVITYTIMVQKKELPLLACFATATRNMHEEIIAILERKAVFVNASPDNPNIKYGSEVHKYSQ